MKRYVIIVPKLNMEASQSRLPRDAMTIRAITTPLNNTVKVYPGRDDIVEIELKNKGEEEAKDVKAIVNPGDPLSTTDDQAFLYTIKPGDTVVASYKIKADSKAVPKTYAVDTVIRYENPDGDIKYSSTLQAPVEVKELGFFQRLFGWV